jgi:hypothetical protein
MHRASAWLHHNRFSGREIPDWKNTVRLDAKKLRETSVLGDAVGPQIQAEQKVAAQAIEAFAARFIAISDDPLPLFQILHSPSECNDFSSEFVSRDQRKTRREFPFMNM